MPTLLQAQQALEVALATHKRARSAATFAATQAAFDDLVTAHVASGNAAKAAETVQAKVVHREKYEKVTTETPDKEKKAEDSAVSDAPETVDSAAASVPAESSEAPAKDAKRAKGKEKGEEEPADEEKALVAAFASANRVYKAKAAGVDAYGVRGPDALLKACLKAFDVTTIGEVFGALASVPEQRAEQADIAKRLAKLENRRAVDDVEAVITKARSEGRTRGSEDRADLRKFAATYGVKALQARIADRPAKRTAAEGYREAAEGTDGNRGVIAELSAEEVTASHERVTRDMTPAEKAVYLEEFNKLNAKKRAGGIPAV